jgi:HlyD family secretion protein
VAWIAAREGDRVSRGETVAVLDTAEVSARIDQAYAQVEAAAALLRELERGSRRGEIAEAEAQAAAARERAEQARLDRERAQVLLEGGALSREAFDQAVTAAQVAAAQARAAQERRQLVEDGPREERVAAQRAELERARASHRGLLAARDGMVVRAPFDGIVTVRHVEPGEVMAPGSPAVTIMNPLDRWVRIYVPETRVGRVHLGQAAGLTTDSHPERRFPGEVSFIASEAEFTPKNVQTTEERVKLVYAVKVRIREDPRLDLKPGMPVDVVLVENAS